MTHTSRMPFAPIAGALAASAAVWASIGAALLLLAGCADTSGAPAAIGPQPIVRSTDRGTAMLTIIACPIGPAGAAILTEYLQALQMSAPVVTATARSTSRLVINTCASPPDAEMIRALGGASRARAAR